MIGTPQNASEQPEGDGKSPPSERQRSDRADQATDPDGRRHIADRLPACIEDLECGDDDEDVEAAADEGLRNDQENDQAGPRSPRDGSKPSREDAPRASLGSGRRGEVDAAFDLDPREERCAHKKRSAHRGRTRARHSQRRRATPAINGPRSVPRLSIVEVAAFDAMSSSGVRASDGSRACSVGR